MHGSRAIFLLGALGLSVDTHAQIFFEHLTPADGLPNDQVLALHEDRDGFIWIGTDGGLARYEGVRIRTWHHDRKDPRSLANNVVWDITEDEQGVLWVATDHGLCAYDRLRGDFDRVYVTEVYNDPTSANRIHRLAADGHGLLWLATEDGIHCISTNTRTGVPIPDAGLEDRLERKMGRVELEPDPALGGVWIGARPGTVFYDANRKIFISRSSPAFPFSCLDDTLSKCATPDPTGGLLWQGGPDARLHGALMDGHTTMDAGIPEASPPPALQFIHRDREGRLWVSCWTHELLVFDPVNAGWTRIMHDDAEPWSITNANAKSWLQDRDGRIWIGTTNGLSVIDPRYAELHSWRLHGSRSDTRITNITVDDDRLLLGTNGDGIVEIDRRNEFQRNVRLEHDERGEGHLMWSNNIDHLVRVGSTWLGGTKDGLVQWDGVSASLKKAAGIVDEEGKLTSGGITFIVPAADGTSWIGTWRSGLFRARDTGPAEHIEYFNDAPLPSKMLLSCVRQGTDVWFGFNNGDGLCRVHNGQMVERLLHEPDSNGTSYGVVPSLAVDEDGTLFIGTLMGGLGVRDAQDGHIDWYTRSDGLAGDRVEQLVLDTSNGLWILTGDGLCRFDRRTRDIRHIDLPMALRSLGPLSAIALDGDGSLLCAIGPLLIDMPTEGSSLASAPDVLLTGLHFGGRSIADWSPDSVIEMRHDQRALSIEYGARTYFSDQGIRFAYRVRDLDPNWTALGASSRLDLNDLPAGTHRVEIRANNGGSLWTREPLALRVNVLPPFWATWWFRIGMILIVAVAAVTGFRLYLRERLREQRERFEREQAVLQERMRIAGDMHDDLGAGLSALKLRSEMALRVEKDPAKRAQLGSLANTAGELIGSMRQIIWTMNQDQAGLEDLVVYSTSYARNYCEENGLLMRVSADGPWPDVQLSTEQRRNVFLVIKEALHNVVKHAHATTVTLTMRANGTLEVALADDGLGLTSSAGDGAGNGLRNMKKRILALGESFALEGTEGTIIRFTIPLPRITEAAPTPNQGSIASVPGQGQLRAQHVE